MPAFQFQQFTVSHDRSTMRVGTDAVLLAALATESATVRQHTQRALDIGTGCGVVALIVAQHCPHARIDAIDIDRDSVTEAARNFNLSPFANRLRAYESSVQDWQGRYDLIVSNPPFFNQSLPNPEARRAAARHTRQLPYSDLLKAVQRLLTPDGTCCVILPDSEAPTLLSLCASYDLSLHRQHFVHPTPSSPALRRIMWLQPRGQCAAIETIHTDLRLPLSASSVSSCSPWYLQLTADLYTGVPR